MDDQPDQPDHSDANEPISDHTLLAETVAETMAETGGEVADGEPAAITTQQIEQVFQWVVEGKGQDDILHSIAEYWPDVPVAELSLAVTTRLMEASHFTPAVVKGMCVEATRLIYQRALETSDLVIALRAIRQLWEMTSTTKI